MAGWGDGGAEGDRTPDLDIANVALSQLSYGPIISGADHVGARSPLSRLEALLSARDAAAWPACLHPLRAAVRLARTVPQGVADS